MSDIAATFAALRNKLAEFTALPLYWPNDDRTPSLDSVTAPAGYVYSEIRVQDEEQIELGATGTRRDHGEMLIYVNVPRGTRTGGAEAYAEQIRALFTPANITGVTVLSKTVDFGSPVESDKGRLWSVPIRIEWFADRVE